MKNVKPVVALAVASVAVIGVLYGYGYFAQTKSEILRQEASVAPQASASHSVSFSPSSEQNALIKQLAIRFLEQYGETIHQPATQAKLYDEWQGLLATYPEQGQWLFEEALALAFPELKDAILSLLQRLAIYYQWLDDNYLTLQRMNILDSQAALWQKREELFGADAEQIWAEERTDLAQKQIAVQAELQRLDQATDISPTDAAYQLQNAVDEIYGEGYIRQLITPDVVASALFSLDSVQTQLQALPEAERQAQINALRKQLGYPDDVIARLEEQDRQREERWKQGYQYMAEREQLARQFSGDDLKRELNGLREKYFGEAAKTIALEEEEGFYRFNRPRRLGLN